MPIRIIQLGSPRQRGEGLRIGTVRRPPRGVRKSQYAQQDWFDVWLPNLAPSASLMRATSIQDDGTGWSTFARRYQAELKQPAQSHFLDVLGHCHIQRAFQSAAIAPTSDAATGRSFGVL